MTPAILYGTGPLELEAAAPPPGHTVIPRHARLSHKLNASFYNRRTHSEAASEDEPLARDFFEARVLPLGALFTVECLAFGV